MQTLIVVEPDPPSPGDGPLDLAFSDGEPHGLLILGLALLCVSLAVVRYGLDAFSRTKLVQTVPEGPRRTLLETCLNDLDRIRIAAMVLWVGAEGVLVVFVLRAAAITVGAGSVLEPLALLLGLPAAALFQVAFCRLLPRMLMSQGAEPVMARLLPWLRWVGIALLPLVIPLTIWRRMLSRVVGLRNPADLDESFSDELRAKVAEGERDGRMAEEEAEMIENVVEFRDVWVSEVMTPRTDVDWVRAESSVMTAIRLAAEEGHSRLPVGEDDSDHIVGVFYVRDVIGRLDQIDDLNTMKVRDLCRKPFFVPETKSIKALLQEFRQHKVHIAIVLDEYGGTAGIVTFEDIVEEIVGDIDDEYDEETAPVLDLLDRDHAHVDGRTRIDEVNDALEIELPESDDFDTLGGLVFTRLGRVPRVGEVMTFDGVECQVLEADDRRVKRLDVKVLSRSGVNGA